jgi:hypothetical protein
MPSVVCRVWEWLRAASPAPLVTIEVAVVGLIVSWLQLRYMKRRDKDIDIRNGWTETHKLMMTFRFKRESLNLINLIYGGNGEVVRAEAQITSEALHNLKGHLDRMSDCSLVEQIAEFLHANWEAERWRSPDFEKQFDEYAKQVARLAQPKAD